MTVTSRPPARPKPRKQDDDVDGDLSFDSLCSDNEATRNKSRSSQHRVAPPRPSVARMRPSIARISIGGSAKRRSSARFISAPQSHSVLQDMYQRALRMHAENRINAQNSWQLPLIDSLSSIPETTQSNFAQASCTIDASIKIYSYRVDDVHLTSYKVLANLNRNDNSNRGDDTDMSAQNDDSESDPHNHRSKRHRYVSEGPTLEANPGM
jgi:Condensin complex subunit 2